MKKLAFVLSLVLIIFCTYLSLLSKNNFYDYFCSVQGVEFCFVVKESVSSKNYVKVLTSGGYDFIYASHNLPSEDILYYEARFCGKENEILEIFSDLNINFLFRERVDDIDILYGYSPFFKMSCNVAGKKVNFQIAVKEEKITVGYPMIYSGY